MNAAPRFRPTTPKPKPVDAKAAQERHEATATLDSLLGPPQPKKKRRAGASRQAITRWRRETVAMAGDKNWADAEVPHLVALFMEMHLVVYDVEAGDLAGKVFQGACSSARKMLADEFDGDVRKMVSYIHWSWQREKDTEDWRQKNGRGHGSLNWRTQFQRRDLLTKWRIDSKRPQHRS